MKRLTAICALGVMSSWLFAQGLNPAGQQKDDWEEINFEFNSSVLSDGYPSLLRLAELLKDHQDYRLRITGHTDSVGSNQFNNRLGTRRAEAVRDFLVKYGAAAGQITIGSSGRATPEAPNTTREGRFINRRVTLQLTDGQGKVIKEGGINDVLKSLSTIQEMLKKQQECCDQILKRLDKLDEILAAVNALKGDTDRLKSELATLRNEHNMLKDQVAALLKPLTSQEATTIAHDEAMGALDEAQRRNKKFSLLGLNIGPTFGPRRTGDFTISGRGRFFSPFGGDGTHAVQAQGEFMYYPGRKEGQFDIGLVNRWGKIQAGAFSSIKWIDFSQFQSGGSMAQAAFLLDYVFRGGRVGAYITRGFKNYAILNRVTLAPGAFQETFARVVNQQGVNFLFGIGRRASLGGDLAYLKMRETPRDARPGANLKLTLPFTDRLAFTVGGSYNETFVTSAGSGRVVFGLEFGNFIRPQEFADVKHPVPMDVPRVRYEFGTRRVGSSPPTANAGPDQTNASAGTITLNASASSDPLGLALTYQWQQISGPAVTLSDPTGITTTFTAAAGQSYSFRLTVRNTDNLTASDSVTVSTATPGQTRIVQFTANPALVPAGQPATLSWVIENATSATISPAPGNVDPRTGSVAVTPATSTTYTLTATGPSGTQTASVTVTVAAATGTAQILRFEASPLNIAPGGSSTLSWTTNGATQVSISGVGPVTANGSTTVSPSQTTTYTLTATSPDGNSVTAPVTVTVAPANIPQIVTFVATPQNIDPGSATQVCWQVTGATSVSISGLGSNLSASDCASVSPANTTTYTLTATNSQGQIQGNVTVNVGQVRILSFTSDPVFSPVSGSAVTLAWQTQNATSVIVVANDVPPQTLPASGSLVVHPTSTTNYTLTAYGPGGQTVSVSIEVFVR